MACNCEEDEGCTCTFTSGFGVVLSGAGTSANPLTLDVDPYSLAVVDGATVFVTLEGDGSLGNRYLLSLDLDPTFVEGYWDRWVGSQAELDAIVAPDPGVLYVVVP